MFKAGDEVDWQVGITSSAGGVNEQDGLQSIQGLIHGIPVLSKCLVFLVATARPWHLAVAAIMLSVLVLPVFDIGRKVTESGNLW